MKGIEVLVDQLVQTQAIDLGEAVFMLVVIVGLVIIIWAIFEIVSSLLFRRTLSDMVQMTLTNVATSINVNTQYLTDSLIKLAQLGHAERLEHLRMNQMMMNDVFTTAKMTLALDALKDIAVGVQRIPPEKGEG